MTKQSNEQSNEHFKISRLKNIALVIAAFLAIHNSVTAAPDPLPDDLRQVPISAGKQGAPNVILMMDDSGSMSADWLPNDNSIDWGGLPSYPGTNDFRHINGTTIKLSNGWFRSHNYSYNPQSFQGL